MAMLTDVDIRIMGLAAEPMLKMLKNLEERQLNSIYGEFRTGKKDFTAELAKWVCIREQILEIQNVLRQHHKAEEKKHDTTSGDRDDRNTDS